MDEPGGQTRKSAECVGIGPKVFAKKAVSKASWRHVCQLGEEPAGSLRYVDGSQVKRSTATGVFADFFAHVHVNDAQLLASRSFVITSAHFRGALGGGIRGFFLSHLMVECAQCRQQPWRLAVCKKQDGH